MHETASKSGYRNKLFKTEPLGYIGKADMNLIVIKTPGVDFQIGEGM